MKFVDKIVQACEADDEHFIFFKRIGGSPEPENAALGAIVVSAMQIEYILDLIEFYEKHGETNSAMTAKNFHFKEALIPLRDFVKDVKMEPVES